MKQELEQEINAACVQLFSHSAPIELGRPDERFGDYSTNVALMLAGSTGQSPREVAERIAASLRERLKETAESVEVAGPGFINLRLHDRSLLADCIRTPAKMRQGQKVVAEYSDPNPFKVLHAGHLYTTIVGDSIARLLEAAGAEVHRLNYGGDVGLHVGKTMWAVLRELGGEYPDKLEGVTGDKRLEWLSRCYIEGNKAYEDDGQAKSEIAALNKRVYDLHAQNDTQSSFAKVYWTCRDWSYEGFKGMYEKLAIIPFERYIAESEVTGAGVELVEKGLDDGVLTHSEGAVIADGSIGEDLHARVFLTSAGLPTYEAKELGLAALKWRDYHFDESVIITANDIVEYMRVVLGVLDHFYPDVVRRSRHLTHGTVKLPGGTKMSSRHGNILQADDILEAADRANRALTGTNSPETVLGAVKYAFLKSRLGGDIIYDPDQAVAIEGNSGPYIQYAHARARSIVRRAKHTAKALDIVDKLESDERSLVRKMGEYAETVERATDELMPHHICTYLYELAQTFNHFYEHNRVLGDARENIRLALVLHYADTLKSGMKLLGVPAPDSM